MILKKFFVDSVIKRRRIRIDISLQRVGKCHFSQSIFLGEYMKSFVSVVSALMVSLSMLAGIASTSSAIASEKVDCSKKENAEKKECKKK